MLRRVANLDLLYPDLPLPERFHAARQAGFERVALSDPYRLPMRDLDRLLTRHHLHLALIATPMGDRAAGERGFMGVPRRIADYRKGFERAVDYANALDVEIIQLMAGVADPVRAHKMLARNLAWSAYKAPDKTLVLGPRDVAGYAIQGHAHALELIDWIGAPNVFLEIDPACVEGLDTGDVLTRHAPRARHIAMSPDDEAPCLEALKTIDYKGFLSVSGSGPF